MQIIIDIQAEDFHQSMSRIRQMIAEPQPVLESIGETLLNRNRERHRKQVDPEGMPWHPLSAMTLANKKSSRILYEYGDMLGSLHPAVSGNVLTLAFGNEKAKWHHEGTKPYQIKPKKAEALKFAGLYRKQVNHPGLPARPLLGFPDDDADAVKHLVKDHIDYLLSKKE
ncbi:MAG: phage virion morphogenesis protein [Oxalobacter formigenes]|nr:phage virion morphogenesis protein [Oxalobacter formigenes]